MAEYYPLLAKAIGSLPNSTPDTRQIVYDRARKALIGQLRTLHPPVPDEDIARESDELDRAVERLEGELASRPLAVAEAGASVAGARAGSAPVAGPARQPLPVAASAAPAGGALGPSERRSPPPPLRTKAPAPRPAPAGPIADAPPGRSPDEPPGSRALLPTASLPTASSPAATLPAAPLPAASVGGGVISDEPAVAAPDAGAGATAGSPAAGPPRGFKLPGGRGASPRGDGQRPFAPQPPSATGAKRPLWIIPLGVGIVVLLVGLAAYKLRDRPQAVVRAAPTDQQQAPSDAGKIAERVGGPAPSDAGDTSQPPAGAPGSAGAAAGAAAANRPVADQPAVAPAPANPELPVAHRAALLVEAPGEANNVRTFLGTVVWKLINVSGGPNDPVGLAVEADVDLPDDKLKAVVTFEKNTDPSLPASHTIKVRFLVQPGSPTGDIKQISVPQLRREDSPTGEGLAGVTVSVVPNSFLVGLSPGAAEANNLELMRSLQWIDVPMLLTSGKIAKLTFEKSESGQRDLGTAVAAWQK